MSVKSMGQNPSPYSEEFSILCAFQVDSCLVTKQPHPASLTHTFWFYQRIFFGKFYIESVVDLQFKSEMCLL